MTKTSENEFENRASTLQYLYWIITIWFMGIVFLFDLLISVGISFGIIYFFPLFIGIFLIDYKKAPFILCLLCSVLIVVGRGSTHPIGFHWEYDINRAISLIFLPFGTMIIVSFKQYFLKLQTSEQKLSTALESAPNGILMVDQEGMIIYINSQIEKTFGYTPKELYGRCIDILVPEKYRKLHSQFRSNYLANPIMKNMGEGRDLYGQSKDNMQIPVEVGLTPLSTSDGCIIMCTIVDISQRKKQEKELVDLNVKLMRKNKEREFMISQLHRSNQELDDFAYIASHDLKEPLRGIFNNARFLKEDYETQLEVNAIKRINRMCFLCQRLEKLVNDLLYYSRLGRQNLAVQSADISHIINEIEEDFREILIEKSVTIKVASEFPIIKCDHLRIKEVFRNLISNAIKYNNSDDKIIEIGYKISKGNDIILFVKDNGIGIDAEFHKEVFRIFKRLNIEEESTKGTGVGLTFVKKIIERHGGEIWIESEINKGTIFYFTLQKWRKNGSN